MATPGVWQRRDVADKITQPCIGAWVTCGYPCYVDRAPSILTSTLTALIVCAGLLAAAASASPRLVAPARGAVLPLGVPPTFLVRDAQDGIATIEVSNSSRADADGVFAQTVWMMGYESRPRGKSIVITPARSSSPRRFWNRPGTYYWHVDRLDCSYLGPRPHVCTHHVTRTRSFTIRGK